MRAAQTFSASASYQSILWAAGPIILGNTTGPILGLVDTAVIGQTGTVADLGAIALGSMIFSFVYWGFGFLRMGTSGFTAQAAGAGQEAEIRATLGRALLQAGVIGLALILLQWPIRSLAFWLLEGSPEVESITHTYFGIRILGAPGGLATYCVMGTLVGLGRSRHILALQTCLNGLNIAFDLLFAGVWGWGVAGIALGTVLAEWLTLGFALVLVIRLLRARQRDDEPLWPWARILDQDRFLRGLSANSDILIRTLSLLLGFAWFTNRSAQFGDVVLAANHILLQFLSFSAFFLDGYALVAESLVGSAVGARRVDLFDGAVRRSTIIAGCTALVLSLGIRVFGEMIIRLLTDSEAIVATARGHLLYTVIYVLFAFGAFQLDGIFIGATRTRDMRNASLLSMSAFVLAEIVLSARWGTPGLWTAFIVYVIVRGLTLGFRYPSLRASVSS